MSTFNAKLPEVVLSKNCAKYLLTRNASEKALFEKQTWLIDKAKSKEERAFCRERERLLQRRLSRKQEVCQISLPSDERVNKPKIMISEDETDKWEVQSDTSCYTKQRRKQGFCSTLWSSQESGLQSVASDEQSSPSMDRKFKRAVSEQNSSTSSQYLSCVLPPISLQRSVSLNEADRRLKKEQKLRTRDRVSFHGP